MRTKLLPAVLSALLILWAASAHAVTITHLTYAGHGQAWMDYLVDRAEAFRAVEPDITVDILTVAGVEGYRDQMTVMIASGAAPDVTDFYPALAGDGVNDRFGIENLAYYLSWQQFVHEAGGQLYDRIVAPTESRFNTEPVRRGVEFARQLIVDDNAVGGSFLAGTAAVATLHGPSIISSLVDAPFRWDIALQPLGPESRATSFGIGGFQIASASRNVEAAWKWLAFLTLEPESAVAYVRTNGRIPTLRSVQPEYQALVPALPGNWTALIETVEQPNSFTLYVLTKNSGSINSVMEGTLREVWSGQTPTEIALERIHEQVTALLNE